MRSRLPRAGNRGTEKQDPRRMPFFSGSTWAHGDSDCPSRIELGKGVLVWIPPEERVSQPRARTRDPPQKVANLKPTL